MVLRTSETEHATVSIKKPSLSEQQNWEMVSILYTRSVYPSSCTSYTHRGGYDYFGWLTGREVRWAP